MVILFTSFQLAIDKTNSVLLKFTRSLKPTRTDSKSKIGVFVKAQWKTFLPKFASRTETTMLEIKILLYFI